MPSGIVGPNYQIPPDLVTFKFTQSGHTLRRTPEGPFLAKNLAIDYKYLSNSSEFFFIARKKAEEVITLGNSLKTGKSCHGKEFGGNFLKNFAEITRFRYYCLWGHPQNTWFFLWTPFTKLYVNKQNRS